MLDSYSSMRSVYGKATRDISELRRIVGEYESAANAYFTTPEITVNTNNSWMSMQSPHSRYDAYCSYSNYHRPSTDSRMSFTISGYSSFTFYIRSNAEGANDFVMVGRINTVPARMSNYANTCDNQNSGTQFNSYTPVTFNNLDPSSSYTIYVVYTKDNASDIGDDRSYVLIPKV